MPDDLLDPSDDEDRKRDSFATATADEKVAAELLTTKCKFRLVLSDRWGKVEDERAGKWESGR